MDDMLSILYNWTDSAADYSKFDDSYASNAMEEEYTLTGLAYFTFGGLRWRIKLVG